MDRCALWAIQVSAFIPSLNQRVRCEWTERALTREEAFDLAIERFDDRCAAVFGEDARYEFGDLVIDPVSAKSASATA